MKRYFYINCLVLTLIMPGIVTPSGLWADDDVEIGSLVLNRTITRVGYEFYQAFSENWFPPKEFGPVHVKIIEKPSARWGSLVSVFIDDRLVYRNILGLRSRNISKEGKDAADAVTSQFWQNLLFKKYNMKIEGDLAGDGLS